MTAKEIPKNARVRPSSASELRSIADESSDGKWYPAKSIASLHVRGLPGSERRVHDVARRENWLSREMPAQGGKRGIRVEYQPPPDVQRQIDEVEARRANEPAAAHYKVTPSIEPLVASRIDRDLLVEISVKLERAFVASAAVSASFSAFVRKNSEAMVDFVRSLREQKEPDAVRVNQLLAALATAWTHHTALHTMVAIDIYNQAVAMTGEARRTRFINEEVESFVRVVELVATTNK